MAIKKIQIIPEGTNDYGDVLHPETSADIVIDTAAKVIMTAAERTKLAGIGTGANVTSVAGRTGAVTLAKADVGLANVDNVKQMPIAGGTFTGQAIAQANTNYTTAQLRNIILSTADASGTAPNGAVYIKYKP